MHIVSFTRTRNPSIILRQHFFKFELQCTCTSILVSLAFSFTPVIFKHNNKNNTCLYITVQTTEWPLEVLERETRSVDLSVQVQSLG